MQQCERTDVFLVIDLLFDQLNCVAESHVQRYRLACKQATNHTTPATGHPWARATASNANQQIRTRRGLLHATMHAASSQAAEHSAAKTAEHSAQKKRLTGDRFAKDLHAGVQTQNAKVGVKSVAGLRADTPLSEAARGRSSETRNYTAATATQRHATKQRTANNLARHSCNQRPPWYQCPP
jgi:exopolysaccharide biosynthesis protein